MERQSFRNSAFELIVSTAIGLAILSITLASSDSAMARDTADPALRDYLSANGLLNRGMNDLAIAEYRKFLTASPNHDKAPLARYGLGVALFRTKDFENAAKELEPLSSLAKFEFAAEVKLVLGQSHLHLQNYAKAAGALDTLLKQHADHDLADDGAALLAEALYRDEKYAQVKPPVDTLISKWPQSPHRERAEFFAALARMAQEDYAGAASSFGDLLSRFGNGIFAEQSTLYMAQCLQRSNAAEHAIPHYESLIKKNSAETGPDALLGLATIHQQKHEYAKAGDLLDQLLEKFPDHRLTGPALIQRGRAWFDQNKFNEAFNAFSKADAIASVAKDQTAYWLAKCELRSGEYLNAAARLDKAIEQHPKSDLAAEMMYDRAIALMRGGESEGAATLLGQFESKFASHALAADALYLHAMIEHQQRRFDASQKLCEKFLSAHGKHTLAPAIAFLTGENEFLSDRFEPAIARYNAFISAFPNDDQLAKAKFRLGSAHYRLKQHDHAEPLLMEVVDSRKTAESFRWALYMLGDMRFASGDWARSAEYFADYLSFGHEQPSADDALLKMGLALGRQDRVDDAIKAFATLEKDFPQSVHRVQATFERGQLRVAQKNLEGAAQAFEQVVAEGGNSRFLPHALNHLSAIAMQQQQYEKASELYAQLANSADAGELGAQAKFLRGQALLAAKQFRPAADAFAEFTKANPEDSRAGHAHAQRAIALARQGEEVEALKAIELVQRDHAATLSPDLLAAVLYEKAWCLRELAKNEEAAQAYRELLASHESQAVSVHALLELAELEFAAEKHQECATLLTKLRQRAESATNDVSPEVMEPALYRLAVAKFELGEHEESAAMSEAFIKQFPASALIASAHSFAGEALFKLEKHQKAAEHFKIVVDQFESDLSSGASMLRLGECQAALDQWKQSEETFVNYLKKFKDSEFWFQAQFGLGWAHENQNRHDEAMASYRKVIERHSGPTAARAQFQIGECLFAKKKFDEAVRELLKVDILYGYPEWSAAALYEAGRCFEELAKHEEAAAQYEQVRQKFPDTRWAKLAAQRLAAQSNGHTSGG